MFGLMGIMESLKIAERRTSLRLALAMSASCALVTIPGVQFEAWPAASLKYGPEMQLAQFISLTIFLGCGTYLGITRTRAFDKNRILTASVDELEFLMTFVVEGARGIRSTHSRAAFLLCQSGIVKRHKPKSTSKVTLSAYTIDDRVFRFLKSNRKIIERMIAESRHLTTP